MLERKLNELAKETAETLGYTLVDSVLIRGKKQTKFKIVIYNPKRSVSTEDCQKVAGILSDRLDVEDFIPGSYSLIVESPGVDRKIQKPEEYDIFRDKDFRFILKDPQKQGLKDNAIVGKVLRHDADKVVIHTGKKEMELSHSNIARANLYFDIKKYL